MKVMAGSMSCRGQVLDHLGPAGHPEAVPRIPTAPLVQCRAVGVGLSCPEQRQDGEPFAPPLGDGEVMMQGHRPVRLDHDLRRPPHRGEPGAEVGRVADGGREAHEGDPRRGEHENLLPHRAPIGILEIVDLVEDHHGQTFEQRRPGEDHVAEDFGGHHHHGRPGLVGHVPGQQAHLAVAVAQRELGELLVGQGLDRRGVEGLATRHDRPGRGILGHQRLARSGRGRHQHRLPPVDGMHGPALEPVERKVEALLEALEEPLPLVPPSIPDGVPDAPGVIAREASR